METFRHEKGKSTGRMEGSDSPASDLPALLKSIKINQRFFYYVMFKPDTPNAIWVPVAKARWTWKVVATRGSAGWGFAPRDKMKPEMFSSTTDFPLYKSNAAENVWVDPPQKGAGEDSCKTE